MGGVATVYVLPASHPCAVVLRALEVKGIAHRRVDLVPVVHKPIMWALFRGTTVPAVSFDDGTKVLGSRAIVRALDDRVPEPPLAVSGRAAEAEAWGDEVLQPLVRRVLWGALTRRPEALASFTEGSRLPVPAKLADLTGPLVALAERRLHGAGEDAVRADVQALGGHLQRVEGWLADGTLGAADPPDAADLQVASSLRLLLTLADLTPVVDASPAGAFARRVFPRYPGHVPAGTLPA